MKSPGTLFSCVLGWALIVVVEMKPTESLSFMSIIQKHNPTISWDPFLEHLAKKRAKCKYEGKRHPVAVKRTSRDGAVIKGFIDGITSNSYDAVSQDAPFILSGLIKEKSFEELVLSSQIVGCYINSECAVRKILCCYFIASDHSPHANVPLSENDVIPKDVGFVAQQPRQQTRLGQVRAFTEEQYRLAEGIVRVAWDRTHLLENLSGVEADCAMVERSEWPWTVASQYARDMGYEIQGVTGTAPNEGNTETALRLILQDMKDSVVSKLSAYNMGCSLIADCRGVGPGNQREEDVLVVCVFRLLPSRDSGRNRNS